MTEIFTLYSLRTLTQFIYLFQNGVKLQACGLTDLQ